MYIKVRVIAGAKKETLIKRGETFFVSVKEPAEQNRANTRVREIIAMHVGIPSKQVRIISGHQSPGKILSIPD